MKFSLCMIVKNEEAVLAGCLDSVKDVFDEIVITDTGSTDSSKQIASLYTDKIYDFKWINDFAAARNFSFSKATGDFIMWLDADDVLKDADRLALIKLKSSISEKTDVVMMKYFTAFEENGEPSFFYYRERLIKRMSSLKWNGFVHEAITPKGNIIYSDIAVCHMPTEKKSKGSTRNLDIYREQLAKGALLSARQCYYYARELFYNGRHAEAALQLEKFIDNPKGRPADKINACTLLYEIYSKKDPPRASEFLSRALSFGTVSPELLCLMGDNCKAQDCISQAIFWYNAALICPKDYLYQGFVVPDYSGFYPLLQLCVCYDALGQHDFARECNRRAGLIKPDSPQVKHNNAYFEQLDKNNGEASDAGNAPEEKNSAEN